MGGVSPVGLKFGDELALMCDLPLSIRNLLLTFGQMFLKGRPVHVGASHHLASLASPAPAIPILLDLSPHRRCRRVLDLQPVVNPARRVRRPEPPPSSPHTLAANPIFLTCTNGRDPKTNVPDPEPNVSVVVDLEEKKFVVKYSESVRTL
jgi:hypothetical protein